MMTTCPRWLATSLAGAVAALALVGCARADDDRIHKAAHRGDLAQVKALLKEGVKPDARDGFGGTALHAAMFQDDLQVVELLLAHGFDPNAVGRSNGYTPLHDAVWASNLPAARLLLARGARTDVKGKDGLTPLEKAVREGRKELAEELKRSPPRAGGAERGASSYPPSTMSVPARTAASCLFEIQPTRSVSRLRSRVTSWETLATESLGRLVLRAGRATFPGASAQRRSLVRGTHTAVAMRLRSKAQGLRAWPRGAGPAADVLYGPELFA